MFNEVIIVTAAVPHNLRLTYFFIIASVGLMEGGLVAMYLVFYFRNDLNRFFADVLLSVK